MQRNLLGVFALGLLVLGALLALGYASPNGTSSFAGGALKIGLVLGAFWLALPQIDRFLARTPAWLLISTFIGLVLIVLRPLSALLIVPLLFGLWFLSVKWFGKWK